MTELVQSYAGIQIVAIHLATQETPRRLRIQTLHLGIRIQTAGSSALVLVSPLARMVEQHSGIEFLEMLLIGA
jgi:hypothetical protein